LFTDHCRSHPESLRNQPSQVERYASAAKTTIYTKLIAPKPNPLSSQKRLAESFSASQSRTTTQIPKAATNQIALHVTEQARPRITPVASNHGRHFLVRCFVSI